MDADQIAEPYAAVADEYARRVRIGSPKDAHRWLYDAMQAVAALRNRPGDLPTVSDWMALATVQAAAHPVDVEWLALTEWTQRPDSKPHGTQAAVARHRYHREPLCALCRAWDAGWHAGRYQAKKAAKEEAA